MTNTIRQYCSFPLKGVVALPLSEDAFLDVPSVTFDVPIPDELPRPKEVQSPINITFLPLTESISSRDPASIENDVVDVVLARESKLFGPSAGVSHESDSDFEHIEGLRIIRDVITGLFRYAQRQYQNLETSQEYIEILESELFKSRDLEGRTYEIKLRLQKHLGEHAAHSLKFLMTFCREGEAKLRLLERIDSEFAAAKKRKPFIDSDRLDPEQEVLLDRMKRIVKDVVLKKSIKSREVEREKRNSD